VAPRRRSGEIAPNAHKFLNPKSQGWSRKELVMRPATGAKAGDFGVLRYTVTAAGVSPVRGSITVIAGRPELRVNEGEDVRGHGPGDAFDVAPAENLIRTGQSGTQVNESPVTEHK
jgi:hypothetical protein